MSRILYKKVIIFIFSVFLIACDNSPQHYNQFLEDSNKSNELGNVIHVVTPVKDYPNGAILFRLSQNSFVFGNDDTVRHEYNFDEYQTRKASRFSFIIASPIDDLRKGPTGLVLNDDYSDSTQALIDVALEKRNASDSNYQYRNMEIANQKLVEINDPRGIFSDKAYTNPNLAEYYKAIQDSIEDLNSVSSEKLIPPTSKSKHPAKIYYLLKNFSYRDAISEPLTINCYYKSESELVGLCHGYFYYKPEIAVEFTFSPKALVRWKNIFQDVYDYIAQHQINIKS